MGRGALVLQDFTYSITWHAMQGAGAGLFIRPKHIVGHISWGILLGHIQRAWHLNGHEHCQNHPQEQFPGQVPVVVQLDRAHSGATM